MRLIDADALKLAIVEEGQKSKRYKIGEFWELNRDEIWNAIDAQPTIEERKKGEWIPISDGYVDIYECNQCGETEDYERNYCPNCGADMRNAVEIARDIRRKLNDYSYMDHSDMRNRESSTEFYAVKDDAERRRIKGQCLCRIC